MLGSAFAPNKIIIKTMMVTLNYDSTLREIMNEKFSEIECWTVHLNPSRNYNDNVKELIFIAINHVWIQQFCDTGCWEVY